MRVIIEKEYDKDTGKLIKETIISEDEQENIECVIPIDRNITC